MMNGIGPGIVLDITCIVCLSVEEPAFDHDLIAICITESSYFTKRLILTRIPIKTI